MKKLFIISAVLLVFVLIFLGVYNFVFREERPAPPASQTIQQEAPVMPETPKQDKKQLHAISEEPVLGAVFDEKNGTILYYGTNDGFVWKTDLSGEKKERISLTKLDNLKNITWSPERTSFLAEFEKEKDPAFLNYALEGNKEIVLKSGLDTAVWDNFGAKIFYKYYDEASGERSLNVSNPDGNDWKKITDVKYRNITIAAVPLSSYVSFWNQPDANEETSLSVVGIAGGEQKELLKEKFGADYIWSPDGTNVLVSSLSEKNGKTFSLGTINLSGEYNNLGIPTLVSKCVWSKDGKTVYYALPGGIPEDAIMPNDYQNKKFNTEDTFWKIDLSSGKKERMIDVDKIDGKIDSENLFFSETEKALYFTNRIDGKLYKLDVRQ